jgi:hypothetical protein
VRNHAVRSAIPTLVFMSVLGIVLLRLLGFLVLVLRRLKGLLVPIMHVSSSV